MAIWKIVVLTFSVLVAHSATASHAFEPCRITIVDKSNGWPVPLVELRTTHQVRFVSDNAGIVAFDLPEMMGTETWLSVEGHGYSVPADGFGFRGVRVTPTEGGKITLQVERQLPAKRLGRITGAGLFGEAQRFGEFADWREQGIVGCDSVQYTEHRGRAYWMWGDTMVARYPLGLFDMLGATTSLEPLTSFKPPVQLRYDYFRDSEGKPRSIADMPGDGPTWLNGFASLRDENGEERLVATYTKIRNHLEAYETGLCVWNEDAEQFDKLRTLWSKTDARPNAPFAPEGHPVRWKDESGTEWLLFGDPLPRLKCLATYEAWSNPKQWQVIEPQRLVSTVDRRKQITPHRGSIAYNLYRQKWVTVFTQEHGDSPLGEIWYAEADSPTGPWEDAMHVVTHSNYTFYNPRLHNEWAAKDSPVLLFEATYTAEFANHAQPTPRHNYNQVLYRLDLNEMNDLSRR